jgi:hypothetical protein
MIDTPIAEQAEDALRHNYLRCVFPQIHFWQCGQRCGGSRAMSLTMA